MRRKVLLVTETIAGHGHLRAAEAIQQAMQLVAPNIETKLVTTMPFVSSALERTVRKVYLNTLKVAPKMWGWAYESERVTSSFLKEGLARTVAVKLEALLDEEQPDVVVCTHAFSVGAFGFLKQKRPSFVLGAVITDFDLNGFWVHEGVDFYLVSNEQLKRKLVERFDIPAYRIHVTGIPIDLKFAPILRTQNREKLRQRLGIAREEFFLLVTGGGTGYGPLDQVVEVLDGLDGPLVIAVITGQNTEMYVKLMDIAAKSRHRVRLYGYVDNMEEFMLAADLMISKPGGLSVSEALAIGLPLLIVQPIPGQEERNSRYLVKQRVAFKAEELDEVAEIVKQVMHRPEVLDVMREAAERLGKPYASLQASGIILDYLNLPVLETPIPTK
ncbi:MAG: hypothetical protein BAA01_12485 [Bacillus thermozeamaize]|uniref:Galactosyldiacylglycerol synthase n=1 Tax=Bacillus thermozeamaize TaxID=230954 RepID=A0A1Y3PSY4_9BACI|nr:MAG: hypothetical protein BAA01_12485 [Bacillus thermozeamaize]